MRTASFWSLFVLSFLTIGFTESCSTETEKTGLETAVKDEKKPEVTAEETSEEALAKAWKKGWDSKKVLAIPKGERPDPFIYLEESYIVGHLKLFDNGAVRFCSKKALATYGTLGPDGGFVMSKDDFDSVIEELGDDMAAIEKKLGLEAGYLNSDDVLIVAIADPAKYDLRMPTGNEAGANAQWLPGGITSGGIDEAVMNFSGKPSYKEIKLD